MIEIYLGDKFGNKIEGVEKVTPLFKLNKNTKLIFKSKSDNTIDVEFNTIIIIKDDKRYVIPLTCEKEYAKLGLDTELKIANFVSDDLLKRLYPIKSYFLRVNSDCTKIEYHSTLFLIHKTNIESVTFYDCYGAIIEILPTQENLDKLTKVLSMGECEYYLEKEIFESKNNCTIFSARAMSQYVNKIIKTMEE